jgi:hypothetical protein
VVAVPDAILAGDANFFPGHGDVDRDDCLEKVLSRRKRSEEHAQQSCRWKEVYESSRVRLSSQVKERLVLCYD